MIIAIDGPSASGKGTICKLLSEQLHLPHLNTGGLYRGVAYKAMQSKLDLNDESKIVEVAKCLTMEDTNNPIIFTEAVAGQAAIVAKIQAVRDVLLKYQREFASSKDGAILEGRDIGTVVCPNATYKFFITASLEERANRRYKEMKEKNQNVNYEEIFKQLKDRDDKDKNRISSPLKMADDAILVDTSDKTPKEVCEYILFSISKNIK